jgi:hypothetical protein
LAAIAAAEAAAELQARMEAELSALRAGTADDAAELEELLARTVLEEQADRKFSAAACIQSLVRGRIARIAYAINLRQKIAEAAQQLAQHLLYPLVETQSKPRAMSATSFQEKLLITGAIQIQDVVAIAAVLQIENLNVTADELQQHLSTWEHSDDYVMCESDMVTRFTKFTEEKLALPVEDKVVNNSVDAKASCAMDLAELETAPKDKSVAYAMDLAELETALKDKSVDNMHSLSQRVKQLVLETFNNLLLNIVHGVGVELDQEDILELRDEKITRDLPDIIKEAVKLDTDAIYVTHEGGSEQLVLDLAVLPVKDQE